MARPFKQRRICALPKTYEFIPNTSKQTDTVEMTVDEYEVIRLIDHLNLTQNECSQQMQVARTTVQSIYNSARSKLADAVVNGKKLMIQGGNYSICPHTSACCGKNCGRRQYNGQCRKQTGGSLCCSTENDRNTTE